MDNRLNEARVIINEVDSKIADLWTRRMKAVVMVIQYKIDHQLPIFDEQRELEVIEKNVNLIQEEVLKPYYKKFIQETMNISKAYQQTFLIQDKVAYQGCEGAFGYHALRQHFKQEEAVAYPLVKSVFEAVEQHQVQNGILPIENSFTGDVGEVLDLLYTHNVYVSDVVNLKVDQQLVGLKGTKVEDIQQIYSHQQALSQCKKFLTGRNIELIPYGNTALAAKYVKDENDFHKAAIASKSTAELYDLEVLVENIHDANDNTTKFIVLDSQLPACGNRVSMMFTVAHESGALAKIMQHIGEKGFNLEAVKSRSLESIAWKYYFYLEVVADYQHVSFKELLNDLKELTENFKVVGVYTVSEQ